MSIPTQRARILSVTRRFADIMFDTGEISQAMLSSAAICAVPGDFVICSRKSSGDLVVTQLLPTQNQLKRSFFGKVVPVVSNIDRIFIIAALPHLISCELIDRCLVAAAYSSIQPVLVFNKNDIGTPPVEITEIYRRVGIDLLNTNTIHPEGLQPFRHYLARHDIAAFALIGASGVGKSSIIRAFVPEAEIAVGELSLKNARGRSTTSQPCGYITKLENQKQIVAYDLPGVSSYGLLQIERSQLRNYFVEFGRFAGNCKYADCLHVDEPQCSVVDATESGEVAFTRYASYIKFLDECQEGYLHKKAQVRSQSAAKQKLSYVGKKEREYKK